MDQEHNDRPVFPNNRVPLFEVKLHRDNGNVPVTVGDTSARRSNQICSWNVLSQEPQRWWQPVMIWHTTPAGYWIICNIFCRDKDKELQNSSDLMQIYISTLLAFSWLTAVSEHTLYKLTVFPSDTLTADVVVYARRGCSRGRNLRLSAYETTSWIAQPPCQRTQRAQRKIR